MSLSNTNAPHFPEPFETQKIRPPDADWGEIDSAVLIRTDELEVIRLVIGAGQRLRANWVTFGIMVMQCIEGIVELNVASVTRQLMAGDLLYFPATAAHSIRGIENTILLVTAVRCPSDIKRNP
jgi:hypothetical protein